MERSSLIKIFEKIYNKETQKDKINWILVESTAIFKENSDAKYGIEWLPGAEVTLGLISSRPEDTQIVLFNERFNVENILQCLRKSRVFAEVTSDPVYLKNIDIIISPRSGFIYTDFADIKEFFEKL